MISSESSETRDKLKSPISRKLPAMYEISASGLSAITLEKSRAYNPVIKPSVDKWERKWTAVDHWGLLMTPFGQTLGPRVDLRWNALTLVTAEIFSCNDAEFGSERNLWLWYFLPLCNNWVHGLTRTNLVFRDCRHRNGQIACLVSLSCKLSWKWVSVFSRLRKNFLLRRKPLA